MVSFRYRSWRQKEQAERSRLMVLGALGALQATGSGVVPTPPTSMMPSGEGGMGGVGGVAPMSAPADPLAALGGAPAPALGASPATQPPAMAGGMPTPPAVTPPLAPPPLLMEAGGIVEPGLGPPTPQPGAMLPPAPSPDDDIDGTVPNDKLFEVAARRIMAKGRGNAAMAGEPAAVAARADIGTQPAAAMVPTPQRQGSELDFLMEHADADPAPAAFLSWLTSEDAKTSKMGVLLAKAYARNPEIDGQLYAAAKDIADEAPGEFPEHIRNLLRGR